VIECESDMKGDHRIRKFGLEMKTDMENEEEKQRQKDGQKRQTDSQGQGE